MNKLKYAVILLLGLSMTFMTSCTKDPNNGGNGGGNGGGNNSGGGGNGTYNGHEYVDLGLPSGTLWATCNVGANTPDSIGDYFAWGETEQKVYGDYDWSTYKYFSGGLTKYCTNVEYGAHGFCDNLTVLQAEDDAATANWGDGWCTPTKEQYMELLNNTDFSYATLNGVDGRLFTASNGNNIFFPGGGYRRNTSLYGRRNTYYWSSTLHETFELGEGCAWAFMGKAFVDGGQDSYLERYIGVPVRPVRSNH